MELPTVLARLLCPTYYGLKILEKVEFFRMGNVNSVSLLVTTARKTPEFNSISSVSETPS